MEGGQKRGGQRLIACSAAWVEPQLAAERPERVALIVRIAHGYLG